MTVKLIQFKPVLGVQNPSPPCLKLETFLKIAKIAYRSKYSADPRKAPKGKIPYIIDGDIKMGDSSLIIDYLTKKYNVKIDDWLTKEQIAIGYAFTKMLDEYFYWCGIYSRWIDERYWPIYKEKFFSGMPGFAKLFVPKMVRKNMHKQLYNHGLGRHSEKEIYQISYDILEHLSNFLGDKKYFLGDKISSFDAVLYAHLANCVEIEVQSPIKERALKFNNLVEYTKNITKEFYSVGTVINFV